MKKSIGLLLVCLALLSLCGCGKSNAAPDTDEYVFETDYQNNIAGFGGAMSFMQGEDTLYLFRHGFLYSVTDDGKVVPLCTRSNCMHDSEECEAFCDAETHAFYYKGSLYAVGMSQDMLSYGLKQYTPEGRFVKDMFDLPGTLQQVIQHRGVLYYTYYQESEELSDDEIGIPTLACRPMGKGKESILYQGDDSGIYLGNMTAQGNYVYVACVGAAASDYRYLIYQTKTGELKQLEDAVEMVLYQNRLLFTSQNGSRRELCSAALDGTDIQAMNWELKNEVGLVAAFDDILIEDNAVDCNYDSMKDGSYRQCFTVYKNGEYLFDFMLDNIGGMDYSQNVCSPFRITEDAIYVPVVAGGMNDPVRQRDLLRLDREAFELGKIQATVVLSLD